MKKNKTNKIKLSKKKLKSIVLDIFQSKPTTKFSSRQIFKEIRSKTTKITIEKLISTLKREGKIKEASPNKFIISDFQKNKSKGKTLTGKIDVTRSGSAYLIQNDGEDVYISERNRKNAQNGDTVEVSLLKSGKRKSEGIVVKILDRIYTQMIGTFQKSEAFGFVIPNNPKISFDIFVKKEDFNGVEDGDKVLAKIFYWPDKEGANPQGGIIKTINDSNRSDMEMNSILLDNGFDLEFPKNVIFEANQLSAKVETEDLGERLDLRKTTTFTIDPDTAKDFDDAISFNKMENGNIEIGVHIADVSHFVKAGSELDNEAFKRSTSVYLVDRVLPMLPENLSNNLCSLVPNQDRFTFSAIFTFNDKFEIVKRWFGKTIIHSDKRFTYLEAQKVLDDKKGPFFKELEVLNKIAYKLRKDKFDNGAITFDSPEIKFKLDKNGTPVEVYVKKRKDTHLLVEDFMLLANREVATFITNKTDGTPIPFVYRVHDQPDPERIEDFIRFAKDLGVHLKMDTPKQVAASFNKLSELAKENKAIEFLQPLAIRTMAKAIYTTENIGHYGLGFDNYTHFTSPIRRYSDVLVHRILLKNLTKFVRLDKRKLEAKCKHISEQERAAMKAERESIKYKQVEFLSKYVGKEFDGTVNGIIDRGLFIELNENGCEGMIAFESLGEPYNVAENRMTAVGRRSKRTFKIGEQVRVFVLETNLDRRQVEFELMS